MSFPLSEKWVLSLRQCQPCWLMIHFLILIFSPPARQWLNDQFPALRQHRARGFLCPPRTPVTGVGCGGPCGHQTRRRVGTFGLSCSGLSHGQWTGHPERVWHGECITHYPKKFILFPAFYLLVLGHSVQCSSQVEGKEAGDTPVKTSAPCSNFKAYILVQGVVRFFFLPKTHLAVL